MNEAVSRLRLTPMGAGVDSERNSMTKPAAPFDSVGACTVPGLDERGINVSPQESFIMSPEILYVPGNPVPGNPRTTKVGCH
jgi:hypothetical protein